MPHLRCFPMSTDATRFRRLGSQGRYMLLYRFVLAVACLAHPPERFEFEHVAMGTTFRIVLYAVDAERGSQASAKAFRRIDALDRILNDYDTSSEISRLSTTAGSDRWIAVSDDLWAILEYSHSLAIETDGAFDVTVGPLTRLWRWANRRGQLPDADRVARARAAVGHALVEFDSSDHRVRLTAPGMRLDVGAIGKGFAADEALELLEREGIHRALVDAGGDVVASDAPPGSSGWRVAVPELHGARGSAGTKSKNSCLLPTSLAKTVMPAWPFSPVVTYSMPASLKSTPLSSSLAFAASMNASAASSAAASDAFARANCGESTSSGAVDPSWQATSAIDSAAAARGRNGGRLCIAASSSCTCNK